MALPSIAGAAFRVPDLDEHAEALYALLATHWEGIDVECRLPHQYPQMPNEAL